MKKTPLYNEHISLNAKMVDFGGYIMPIQYKGISIEHNCVRNDVGIFDVSHMGEFIVEGKESLIFLENICSNDIGKINVGNAQYNCFTNHNGGIVDDLIVYRLNDNKYMLVVNAANINKDWDWIKENHKNYNCVLKNISDDTGLISVQGPKSYDLMAKVLGPKIKDLKFFGFDYYEFGGAKHLIARSGWSKQGGFEVYMQHTEAGLALYDKLFEVGDEFNLKPGCPNLIERLESSLLSYGNDMDIGDNPLECGFDKYVNLDNDINFLVKEELIKIKSEGIKKKLMGVKIDAKEISVTGSMNMFDKDNIGTMCFLF